MPYTNKEKQREYARKWVAQRRSDFFKGKKCAKCPATERLELDHIDPSTKVTHSIWSWSSERRAAELKKCQILCYDCHKIKTKKDKWKPIPHGTNSSYTGRKCRCKPCCKAHTDTKREYRIRRKQISIA